MQFSYLGVFLISVKSLTTENTENKTTPKICKITVTERKGERRSGKGKDALAETENITNTLTPARARVLHPTKRTHGIFFLLEERSSVWFSRRTFSWAVHVRPLKPHFKTSFWEVVQRVCLRRHDVWITAKTKVLIGASLPKPPQQRGLWCKPIWSVSMLRNAAQHEDAGRTGQILT